MRRRKSRKRRGAKSGRKWSAKINRKRFSRGGIRL